MQTVAMDHLSIGNFLSTASATNNPRRRVQQGAPALRPQIGVVYPLPQAFLGQCFQWVHQQGSNPVSVFGSIMGKIFGGSAHTPPVGTPAGVAGQTTTASTGGQAGAMPTVDVEAVLIGLASKGGESLNWRHSIVDLMKLLNLDSSLSARKELAKELKYTGDVNDSASMNIWLHKQVMQKLAANGGKVPADLQS
jgi:hypothetical protein